MIVVALDPPPNVDAERWCFNIVSKLVGGPRLAGFKIGLPAIIDRGLAWIPRVFEGFDGLLVADLKLADVAPIMEIVLERLRSAGFNTVIVHAFIGREGGLREVAEWCRRNGINLVAVVSMSHPGSRDFIDKHTREMVEMCRELGVWGFVAPATRPEMIRLVRSLAPEAKILSPGIGAQGARPGDALRAGATYEIVGRAITRSPDPRRALEEIAKEQEEALRSI